MLHLVIVPTKLLKTPYSDGRLWIWQGINKIAQLTWKPRGHDLGAVESAGRVSNSSHLCVMLRRILTPGPLRLERSETSISTVPLFLYGSVSIVNKYAELPEFSLRPCYSRCLCSGRPLMYVCWTAWKKSPTNANICLPGLRLLSVTFNNRCGGNVQPVIANVNCGYSPRCDTPGSGGVVFYRITSLLPHNWLFPTAQSCNIVHGPPTRKHCA